MRKNSRKRYIEGAQGSDYAQVRDAIHKLTITLCEIEPLGPKDIEEMAMMGLDAQERVSKASQLLLPKLCCALGRGLTLEEIKHLTEVDEYHIEKILNGRMKIPLMIFKEVADAEKYRKYQVIIAAKRETDAGEEECTLREPVLVHRSRDKRRHKSGLVRRLRGKMPVLYTVRSVEASIESDVAKLGLSTDEWVEKLTEDRAFLEDIIEIRIAQYERDQRLYESEHIKSIIWWNRDYYHVLYDNAIHLAHRYRVFGDMETYEKIEKQLGDVVALANYYNEVYELMDRHNDWGALSKINKGRICEYKSLLDDVENITPATIRLLFDLPASDYE